MFSQLLFTYFNRKKMYRGCENLYFDIFVVVVQCNPAGCLFELWLQLAVIMVGKQIFNNFIEIIIP